MNWWIVAGISVTAGAVAMFVWLQRRRQLSAAARAATAFVLAKTVAAHEKEGAKRKLERHNRKARARIRSAERKLIMEASDDHNPDFVDIIDSNRREQQ